MSSKSWSAEDDSKNHSSSERPQASPPPPSLSSSPPLEWSSDPEDRIPLAQRRVVGEASAWRHPAAAGWAPPRGHRARAGTSSSVGVESPEGAVSTVTSKDLADIRTRYQIPRGVELYLPTPDDRVISSQPGRVAIYEISLRVGLRLPFHPFFVNLLDYYSLTPSQLVPNSLRVICAFIILCCHLHIAPRVSLFLSFYILWSQKGWWLF